jgi:hypothetical protein
MPGVTPLGSEAPASTARQTPGAASQARAPECTLSSVKTTVSGVQAMASYPIGLPLVATATAVNVSNAPCQFSAGYCPDVQVVGPAGITDRWYDTRARGWAGDRAGYVLAPGQSVSVNTVWDQQSCASPSGTCHFQNGWPPAGQYSLQVYWGEIDALRADAPQALTVFNLLS